MALWTAGLASIGSLIAPPASRAAVRCRPGQTPVTGNAPIQFEREPPCRITSALWSLGSRSQPGSRGPLLSASPMPRAQPTSRTSCSSWATTSAGCSRAVYHRGLMVGETPNIDRIANEGGMFMHYYAESSCTAGRNAFITGMHPLRAGMILPQLPGQPVVSAARHAVPRQVPARSRLHHRRVRQEPPRRSPRFAADGARLPGVLGLPLSPRRDAAGELPRHQQDPDRAGRRAAVKNDADSRHSAEVPGAIDPKTASA